jgi:hypothetical protein
MGVSEVRWIALSGQCGAWLARYNRNLSSGPPREMSTVE